ncbi:hypothetical protein P692DRAFT_20879761 [Suillus brevipes Sb2]|nr:hypothetical protein P692DRAFT_20879761 [Suillus brevipes Sb2]
MVHNLEDPKPALPKTAIDLGDGYALLRKCDLYDVQPQGGAAQAIQEYLGVNVKICCWARLRLPNGQTARTAWRATLKPAAKVHVSRNVKFLLDGNIQLGETEPHPDHELLELSFHAASSCKQIEGDIRVIDVKSITDVIGMVPHRPTLPSGVTEDRYFLVEKPGLDIATFGVAYEGPGADDDEDDEAEDNEY